MKILFYVEPLIEKESPTWKRGWIDVVSRIINSLRCDIHSSHSFFTLIGDGLEAYAHKKLQDCPIAIIQYTELIPQFGKSALEVSLMWYKRRESPGVLDRMAQLVLSKLGDFQPDLCISFSPAPFLKQAFSGVPVIHFELGIFSRPPFPMTCYLDPLGMFLSSCLIRFRKEILNFIANEEELSLVKGIREDFLSFIGDHNPFSDLLKERLGQFKSSVLLVLQFSQFYGYDAHARFPEQYDFLVQTLESVPPDVAVIVVEHPEHLVLRKEVVSYLKEKYPNFIWDPQFRNVYSASHFLLEFSDAVITVSSSVGLQSLLWKKPLIVIGHSHLDLVSDSNRMESLQELLNAEWPISKENVLAWLLTRYYLPFEWLLKGRHFEEKLSTLSKSGAESFHFNSIESFSPITEIKEFYREYLKAKNNFEQGEKYGVFTKEPIASSKNFEYVHKQLQVEQLNLAILERQIERNKSHFQDLKSRINEYIKENSDLQLNLAISEQKSEMLENELQRIEESISWKITHPIRLAVLAFKKMNIKLGKWIFTLLQFIWRSLPLSSHKKDQIKIAILGNFNFVFKRIQEFSWIAQGSQGLLANPDICPKVSRGPQMAFAKKIEEKYYFDLSGGALGSLPIKAITFYLPQFHQIPENNKWWGKGFTEWTNTRKAKRLFEGHRQPREPTFLGYYDLTDSTVYDQQVALAKKAGIYGFCFYFYWFGGKTLLESPLRNVLANKQIHFPFCLCWANENWTRRWDGQDSETLIEQSHSYKDSMEFFNYVNSYFLDDRYIKIDGRPILVIYRANIIPEIERIQKLWRDQAKNLGWPDLYLISAQTFGLKDPRPLGFDAAVQFPPHNQRHGFSINHQIANLAGEFKGKIFDYRNMPEQYSAEVKPNFKVFRGVTLGWDNTARRGINATILENFSLSKYTQWLELAVKDTLADHNLNQSEKFIFINAWNEWAEGVYLEPDNWFGFGYLEATKNTIKTYTKNKLKLSVVIPNYNHSVFLERRLKSIICQSRKPDEIIFLDDGSLDGSVEIARKILSKSNVQFSIIENEINSGNVFKQWLKGIELSTGQLIWIAESDDDAAPEFLERIVEAFESDDVLLAYGQINYIKDDDTPSSDLKGYYDEFADINWQGSHKISAYRAFTGAFAVKNLIPNVSGAVFRKPLLTQYEKERLVSYDFSGDWYFYSLISRGGTIAFCKEAVSYFRYYPESTSRKILFSDRHINEHQMILSDLGKIYPIKPEVQQWHIDSLGRVLSQKPGYSFKNGLACLSDLNIISCEKLRVCIATDSFCLGGGEAVPIEIANALRGLGHHVTFLVLNPEAIGEQLGLRMRLREDIPIVYWKNVQENFNEFLKDYGIEIFNSHNVSIEYTLYRNGISVEVPYLVSLHGGYETVPEILTEEFIAFLGKNVDEWLYLSEKNKEVLEDHGLKDSCFSRVFNGVESRSANVGSALNIRKCLNVSEDSILLVLASRALYEKGWQIAINVTSSLRALTGGDFRLLLIGDGKDYKEIKDDNSSKRYIYFLGEIDNPYPIISECDLGVFPSRYSGESFPLFVLECLKGGVPVIASDIGEISHVMSVKEGIKPGYIVSKTLSEEAMTREMVQGILELIDDEEMLSKMKAQAYKVAEEFSIEKVVKIYLQVMSRYVKSTH